MQLNSFVFESLHDSVKVPLSHPSSQHYLLVEPHIIPPALLHLILHVSPVQYLPPETDAITEQTRS